MATSHYCRGKWRSGPVSSCTHHSKLAKKQTNVYKGVGDPGGRSGKAGGRSGGTSKPPPASKPKASGSSDSKKSGD